MLASSGVMRVSRAVAVGVLLALGSGCATYKDDHPRTTSRAFGAPETTKLGRFFGRDAPQHPGESGVVVMRYGRPALVARLAFVDDAEKTLDLQYYIWDADISGSLLGERLVSAAERGVRVRVLLDDISVVGRDDDLARLAGHPNIEIRAFNPFRHRSRRALDLFTNPSRVNRRSHNKIFVVDGAVAIIGGRNIADHYFGVHGESNYRDLDIVAMGPVVADISGVFDDFWNSKFAIPYGAFTDEVPTAEDAEAQFAWLRSAVAGHPMPYPIDDDIVRLREHLGSIRDGAIWSRVEVLYDDPAKAEDKTVKGIVGELAELVRSAETEVLIENAYFVPREPMVAIIEDLTRRGVKVRILTNSLASNDVGAVYSGYVKYRDDLLRAGAEIYEQRPDATAKERWSLLSIRSQAGLHTKAMVVDREHVVIGSYNLDPRSADINSECALLVHSPELGEQVAAFMDEGVAPAEAYHVTLDGGRTRWSQTNGSGEEVVHTTAPMTSWWTRFVTGFVGLLPIHSQL